MVEIEIREVMVTFSSLHQEDVQLTYPRVYSCMGRPGHRSGQWSFPWTRTRGSSRTATIVTHCRLTLRQPPRENGMNKTTRDNQAFISDVICTTYKVNPQFFKT